MGDLAPRLRTLEGSFSPPIDTSGNFPLPVPAQPPLNIYPNLSEVKSEISQPSDNFSKYTPLSAQICHSAGGRGVSKFVCLIERPIFFYLDPHAKFQNPITTFQNAPSVTQICHSAGVGGFPNFC
jgi:hypothetical protein